MNSIFKKRSISINEEMLLDDLFCFLDEFEKDDKFIFRGSTNKTYKLIPSLYRFDLSDYEKVEKIIIKGKLKEIVIKMLKERKQLGIYSVY